MVLPLFSALLFPFTDIVAAIKMNGGKFSDYSVAKRWTTLAFVLFDGGYLVILVLMTSRFVQMLS